jgi:hypothetical protein
MSLTPFEKRQVEAHLEVLDEMVNDDEHRTDCERDVDRHRGTCSCGWRGRWRHGADGGWQAGADADEHYNSESRSPGEATDIGGPPESKTC